MLMMDLPDKMAEMGDKLCMMSAVIYVREEVNDGKLAHLVESL